MTFSLTPDRITTPPHGLAGGHDADMGEVRINGEIVERFPAITLRPGDVVSLDLPGGGGFGDPSERDPKAIARDLRHGYVTPSAAHRHHGYGATGDAGNGVTSPESDA